MTASAVPKFHSEFLGAWVLGFWKCFSSKNLLEHIPQRIFSPPVPQEVLARTLVPSFDSKYGPELGIRPRMESEGFVVETERKMCVGGLWGEAQRLDEMTFCVLSHDGVAGHGSAQHAVIGSVRWSKLH